MSDTKVVFFDLFDTLVKVDRGYLEPYFDRETDRLGDLGILKNAEQTVERLIEINKHNSSEPNLLATKSVDEMARYYEARMRESLMNPPDGVLEMLQGLKDQGIPLCVISDAAFVDIMSWPDSPLAPFFDNTCFSCEVGLVKPDPALFKHAQSMFNNPSQCIFIGDGGHEELMGAQSCGMQTIKAEWIKNRREDAIYEHADRKIQMATQVPNAVQEMYMSVSQNLDEKQNKLGYAALCLKNNIQPIFGTKDNIEWFFGDAINNGFIDGLTVAPETIGLPAETNHLTVLSCADTAVGMILFMESENHNVYALSSVDVSKELLELQNYPQEKVEEIIAEFEQTDADEYTMELNK
jgi:putative hydrolase of the HAD superfamily